MKTRSNRVAMKALDVLTFYADTQTAFRRTGPVPQLECIGKPCSLFQPDVVQCRSMGGDPLQWKCQADLPSSIRFGRVEVSCEGYDSPDDPYILKGSCGLTYNLVRANPNLENGDGASSPYYAGEGSGSLSRTGEFVSRFVGNLTNLLVWSVLAYMLYAILLLPLYTYFRRNAPYAAPGSGAGGNDGPRPPRPWFGGFGGGPGGGGGGGGSGPGNGGGAGGSHFDDDMADIKPSAAQRTGTPAPANVELNAGFRPGFWSGLAAGAGGLAAANTLRNRFADTTAPPARQRWEAPQMQQQQQQHQGRRAQTVQPRGFFGGGGAAGGADWDRGEGGSGSGLGAMRTSSGFGGTRNR